MGVLSRKRLGGWWEASFAVEQKENCFGRGELEPVLFGPAVDSTDRNLQAVLQTG